MKMGEMADAVLSIGIDASAARKGADDFTSAAKDVGRAAASAADAMNALVRVAQATGVAFSAWKLTSMISEATNLAARYETLGVTVRAVGKSSGYTQGELADLEKSLRKTGIAMNESRQVIAQMIQSNMNLANATKLARVAQDAAVIAGRNSSETLQRITYGIQTSQVEVLRSVGINVQWSASYDKMAKSMGTSVDALTNEQKITARVNAVMEQGAYIAGAYEAAMGTAGKQVFSMQRYMADLNTTVGSAFLPAYTDAVFTWAEALKDAQMWAEENTYTLHVVGQTLGAITLLASAAGGAIALAFAIAPLKVFATAMIGASTTMVAWTKTAVTGAAASVIGFEGVTASLYSIVAANTAVAASFGAWALAAASAVTGVLAILGPVVLAVATVQEVLQDRQDTNAEAAWREHTSKSRQTWTRRNRYREEAGGDMRTANELARDDGFDLWVPGAGAKRKNEQQFEDTKKATAALEAQMSAARSSNKLAGELIELKAKTVEHEAKYGKTVEANNLLALQRQSIIEKHALALRDIAKSQHDSLMASLATNDADRNAIAIEQERAKRIKDHGSAGNMTGFIAAQVKERGIAGIKPEELSAVMDSEFGPKLKEYFAEGARAAMKEMEMGTTDTVKGLRQISAEMNKAILGSAAVYVSAVSGKATLSGAARSYNTVEANVADATRSGGLLPTVGSGPSFFDKAFGKTKPLNDEVFKESARMMQRAFTDAYSTILRGGRGTAQAVGEAFRSSIAGALATLAMPRINAISGAITGKFTELQSKVMGQRVEITDTLGKRTGRFTEVPGMSGLAGGAAKAGLGAVAGIMSSIQATSAGSGAMSGAMSGMAFGPVGAAAGAIVGFTAGLINSRKALNEHAKELWKASQEISTNSKKALNSALGNTMANAVLDINEAYKKAMDQVAAYRGDKAFMKNSGANWTLAEWTRNAEQARSASLAALSKGTLDDINKSWMESKGQTSEVSRLDAAKRRTDAEKGVKELLDNGLISAEQFALAMSQIADIATKAEEEIRAADTRKAFDKRAEQVGLDARLLSAQGKGTAADNMRAALDGERELMEMRLKGASPELIAQLETILGLEQKSREEAQARLAMTTGQDLDVRALTATGRGSEASDRAFRYQQEREYYQAVKDGMDAANLKRLEEVQLLEAQARAAEKLLRQQRAQQSIDSEILRLKGRNAEADRMDLNASYADRRRQGEELGMGAAFFAALDEWFALKSGQLTAVTAFNASQQQGGLDARLLDAQGKSREGGAMRATLAAEKELFDLRMSGASPEVIAQMETILSLEKQRRDEAEATADRRAGEDLSVRRLRAQGKGLDAEDMAFALEQEREMYDAVRSAMTAANIERLREVQALEATARAAAMAAQRQQASASLEIELLRLKGKNAEADKKELDLAYADRVAKAQEMKMGDDYMTQLAEWFKIKGDQLAGTTSGDLTMVQDAINDSSSTRAVELGKISSADAGAITAILTLHTTYLAQIAANTAAMVGGDQWVAAPSAQVSVDTTLGGVRAVRRIGLGLPRS